MTKLSKSLRNFFCCFLFFSSQKIVCNPICNPVCQPNEEYEHWFTGPIFTPNPRQLAPFHPGLEVVLISSCTYGIYDHKWKLQNISKIWSIGPYIDFQYSFNEIIGIEYIGSMTSNFSQGATSTHVRDSIFRLGFQISRDRADSWIPDFRILLQETFPTGKYQKLDPQKKGIDLTGDGSFETGAHFAFQKLFHTRGDHCFSIRGDIGYFFPSRVHVKGINYYTGIFNTNGKVYPGQNIVVFLTGEYSLSSKWNIACETFYKYQRSGHFSGKIKATEATSQPSIKVPAFAQFTIAPEIEHTFTPNFGMIIGGAVTPAGKNAPAYYGVFISAVCVF